MIRLLPNSFQYLKLDEINNVYIIDLTCYTTTIDHGHSMQGEGSL